MIVNEINIKLVLFGLGGIGKTSIVNSFLEQQISKKYYPTIGSSISKHEYRLPKFIVKLNVWDVGGQRSFNPLNPVYFNNNDAAFLIFDLSNPQESLKEIKEVYLPSLIEKSEDCISYIIGNKLDLIKTDDELKQITEELRFPNLPLVYVSALENNNINEVFELIIFHFLQDLEVKSPSKKFSGISEGFLNYIGKKEEELSRVLINKIDTKTLRLEDLIMPDIETTVLPTSDINIASIPYPKPITGDLKNIERIIEELIEYNTELLSDVKDKILQLKKTPIDQLNLQIDKISLDLDTLKMNLEKEIEEMLKFKGPETDKKTDKITLK